MSKVDFTIGELNHILLLISDKEREGSYYMSKRNWDKQTQNIKKKIAIMFERKIERECKKLIKQYLEMKDV